MFSGRGKLICVIYRKKGVPFVSLSYNAVKKTMNSAENQLKSFLKKQRKILESLDEIRIEMKRNERLIKFIKKRIKE